MGNITKVDLITGFLGAGKTTYIKRYIEYFRREGKTFAVIENEYGMAGIDSMILAESGVFVRELSGGCICCALKTNFHDVLLSFGGLYDRIIIEPSGIFDPSDFFMIMESSAVSAVCEYGCMVTVVDPAMEEMMTDDDKSVLAGELLNTGKIIQRDEIFALTDDDFAIISNAKPQKRELTISPVDHTTLFQSCTLYPNAVFEEDEIPHVANVWRIKGYLKANDGSWLINYAGGSHKPEKINREITPMINIIGRRLDRKYLKSLFKIRVK
ncbi:MAG: hypothetical protein FWF15_00795 [Oscillospiraceae bacterium]|nr:hypothetical protein [Oscillospiraceae bacterium]